MSLGYLSPFASFEGFGFGFCVQGFGGLVMEELFLTRYESLTQQSRKCMLCNGSFLSSKIKWLRPVGASFDVHGRNTNPDSGLQGTGNKVGQFTLCPASLGFSFGIVYVLLPRKGTKSLGIRSRLDPSLGSEGAGVGGVQ